jgi:hypothetical protein
VVLKVNTLIIILFKRVKERAISILSFKLKLKLKGILYYLSSLSFLSLLKKLIKENIGFNLLLNNPKLKKLNKSDL